MSKTSNLKKQLARQKSVQPKREENQRPTKKGESMATFIKARPKPSSTGTFNKNGEGKQKKEGQRFTL